MTQPDENLFTFQNEVATLQVDINTLVGGYNGNEIDFDDWDGENTMTSPLHAVYTTAFHPDPDLIIPAARSADHTHDNTHITPIPSLINAAFGNCSADNLILNSTQFATLRDVIANVDDQYTLSYIIPVELPPVTAQNVRNLKIPTFPLPDDARRITSPLPFAIYQRKNYFNNPTPFIHNYYALFEERIQQQCPVYAPSPFFTNSADRHIPALLPPLEDHETSGMKLTALDYPHHEENRGGKRSIAELEKEHELFHSASTRNPDCKTVYQIVEKPICGPPFTSPLTVKKPRFQEPTPYWPSLPSPASAIVTDQDQDDSDNTSVSSQWSGWSVDSDYPVPPGKIAPIDSVSLERTKNTYSDPLFDPIEIQTRTPSRLLSIPYINGYFDGQDRFRGETQNMSHLFHPLEYTNEYSPVPFNGKFSNLFVASTTLLAAGTFRTLKDFQRQSNRCNAEYITIYGLHGNTIAPIYVHRGQFIQQYAPTANPLLTPDESAFLRIACSVLRFYGQVSLANYIDAILQTPLPDEDLITALLVYNHLDDRSGQVKTNHRSTSNVPDSLFKLSRHLYTKQERYYRMYGGGDIAPPPSVPTSLYALRAN
ncbi:hypothetical protein EV363DRAFT_1457427 [Boletus edulis]|nr:hypothetical protein EV363DRAFT_1457427 [Boletus edulis]